MAEERSTAGGGPPGEGRVEGARYLVRVGVVISQKRRKSLLPYFYRAAPGSLSVSHRKTLVRQLFPPRVDVGEDVLRHLSYLLCDHDLLAQVHSQRADEGFEEGGAGGGEDVASEAAACSRRPQVAQGLGSLWPFAPQQMPYQTRRLAATQGPRATTWRGERARIPTLRYAIALLGSSSKALLAHRSAAISCSSESDPAVR